MNEKPKELKLHQNRENGSVPAIGFQVDANLKHAIGLRQQKEVIYAATKVYL